METGQKSRMREGRRESGVVNLGKGLTVLHRGAVAFFLDESKYGQKHPAVLSCNRESCQNLQKSRIEDLKTITGL